MIKILYMRYLITIFKILLLFNLFYRLKFKRTLEMKVYVVSIRTMLYKGIFWAIKNSNF